MVHMAEEMDEDGDSEVTFLGMCKAFSKRIIEPDVENNYSALDEQTLNISSQFS